MHIQRILESHNLVLVKEETQRERGGQEWELEVYSEGKQLKKGLPPKFDIH